MSVVQTVVVGGGGGGGGDPAPTAVQLMMPEFSYTNGDIQIRTATGVASQESAAAAWVAFDLDHSQEFYETTTLICTADTTEQTIVDTSGNGVLTHVLGPGIGSTGTLTIRITVDGVEEVYISPSMSTSDTRYVMGDFRQYGAVTVSAAGPGGNLDEGYLADPKGFMVTTPQTISVGRIGIVFETSLKVTVQGSVNITATAFRNRTLACYSTYIPIGLV